MDGRVETAARRRAGFGFVALMASLGAVNAVSTDIVIPGLGLIDAEFGLSDPNLRQWALYAVFLGMAVSQLVLGPVADRFGRRAAVFGGLAVFLLGCAAAAAAPSYGALLAGRFLQGLGSGGLRVVSMAVTRDRFSGDEMARVVSLSTAVFVVMVFAAPLVGQGMLALGPWRWLFLLLAVQALATGLWFALAQPETLDPARRRPISPRAVARTFAEIARTPATLACALALGAAFGAFAGYLASAQQVFGEVYALGVWLPVAFGAVSLFYGAMALVNARAVGRFGTVRLARWALALWAVWGIGGAVGFGPLAAGVPPLWLWMVWASVAVAGFAFIYGNLQALALVPMGDRAGSASSAVAAFATLCGVIVAATVGATFDGTVVPLTASFGAAGLAGLLAVRRATRRGAFA